jgi:hypothetical protein
MKKRLIVFVAAFLMLFMAVPAMAALQDMYADVYKWTGGFNQDGSPGLTKITSGITFEVRSHDSNTRETLYVFNSKALTSLSNPVTTTNFASSSYCNKRVAFRVDPTDSTDDKYVDLLVVDTNTGCVEIVKHFDKYTHTIIIDERPNIRHHGVIWYTQTTTARTDTGIDLPSGSLAVYDVTVEVIKAGLGATIKVGTGENSTAAAGYLSGRSIDSTGFSMDAAFITSGTCVDYYPVTTFGTYLATGVTGTGLGGADSGKAINGGLSRLTHFITAAASNRALTYTANSAEGATYYGYIHYWFEEIR